MTSRRTGRETIDAAPPGGDPAEVLHLLVLGPSSSSLHALPRRGESVLGRGSGANIVLDDDAASKRHACLTIVDGEVRVRDLGSRNGTFLNGERIDSARDLAPGDELLIGHTTVVLRGARRPPRRSTIVDATTLRGRLRDEAERALTFERRLAVVAAAFDVGSAESGDPARAWQHRRAEVERVLATRLRSVDFVAWTSDALLVAVLPEVADGAVGRSSAQALFDAIRRVEPAVRGGLAVAPEDGFDGDALIAAARGAATSAPAGELVAASDAALRLELDGRTVVIADPAMLRVFDLVRRLAASPLPVLLHGETGSGKDVVAQALHHFSPRRDARLLAINCAGIPESIADSELFGAEKGAYSGAATARPGVFEQASGGTLLLDEVAELTLAVQAKLLRALESGRITRLGGTREIPVDVRVVAATNRDLERDVRDGRFRRDLYFRLAAGVVIVPPLRERQRELALLARTLLDEACRRLGSPPKRLGGSALQALARHDFTGNVRELKNLMDLVAATCDAATIEREHLPAHVGGAPKEAEGAADAIATPPTVDAVAAEPSAAAGGTAPAGARPPFRSVAEEVRELERTRMVEALAATGGVRSRAAELIGMPIRTFSEKLKQYGIVDGGDHPRRGGGRGGT